MALYTTVWSGALHETLLEDTFLYNISAIFFGEIAVIGDIVHLHQQQ